MVQFFHPSALAQNLGPVTHPGATVGAAETTALVANAVLFAVFQSPLFETATLNVTLVPADAGKGLTGIRKVSSPKDTIVVVLVQVTVVAICAPQDHHPSTKGLVGPEIFVGRVKTTLCKPLDERFPTLETTTGICDKKPTVRDHSGCPRPGMGSAIFIASNGVTFHSTTPE